MRAARRWWRHLTRRKGGEQWGELAQVASRLRPSVLQDLADEARRVGSDLNRFLMRADHRYGLSQATLDRVPLPQGTDWRWRPDLLAGRLRPAGIVGPAPGSRFGDEIRLWHDCPGRALILRQRMNRDVGELAPYAIMIETLCGDASYLSLSLDLPGDALPGFGAASVLRVELGLRVEAPVPVYARLNVDGKSGQGQMLQRLEGLDTGRAVVEFDLAYLEIGFPVTHAWVDLILEQPGHNAFDLRELILSRHVRAQI